MRTGANDALSRYLADTAYRNLRVQKPVLIGAGSKDRDRPTARQKLLAMDACREGTQIQFHLYEGLTHTGGNE